MSNDKSKKVRSPSYPSMSLESAVEAVGEIEGQYRSSPVDRTVAARLIGYTTLSGPAAKALAALASFGLLERAGKGEARVTERARAILHARSEDERIQNLRAAALEPPLFRELRERFEGIAVPPEDGVVTFLHREGFNPSAVRPAAKAFLDTMSYLEQFRASESHGHEKPEAPKSPAVDGNPAATKFGGARVGDLVQWESQGVLQFPQSQRVRLVSDDGEWIAVDGSATGIPMNEVIVEERAKAVAPQFPLAADEDIQPQASGEVEWMRNRVGKETNVRLLVKGDMGPKEIKRLIRLLEAQRAVLMDEDDAEEDD